MMNRIARAESRSPHAGRRPSIFTVALMALTLVAPLARPAWAEIAEPHHVLYGRATRGGAPLDGGTTIRLVVGGQEIASFAYGSDPESPDLYVLRAPLDTVGERPPGVARRGDSAEIYFDDELVSAIDIGLAGTARNLDLDPELLTAAIHIGNLDLFEGASGTTMATLTVSINQPASVDVEVDFVTRDGSASSGSDYLPDLGRVTIPAGELTSTVEIEIVGDTVPEADEGFHVDLSNPVNGVLFDHEALVTILDDDTPPSLHVQDVVVTEPNPGASQESSFVVRLSHPWSQPVSFDYAALDQAGQAVNGTDYVLGPGVGSIPAGELVTEIPFTVLGDVDDEPDETFELHLSNPIEASLGDGVGQALLTDYVRFLRYVEHTVNGDGPAEPGTSAPGLAAAYDVDISPDGQNVYVAGRGNDAVVAFDRAGDGTLTHLATYRDGVDGIDGLEDVEVVHVSADGSKLFAASYEGNAVASFLRQPDGTLIFVDHDIDGFVDPESTRVVQGLAGAVALAEAPGSDGHPDHLYVAGQLDNAVAVFQVLADGRLEYETVVRDGVAGVDGLAQASSIVVSPGGEHVYVSGFLDDAVAVFARNVDDGFLAFRELHRNAVSGVFALDGAVDMVLDADGELLYVAGMLSSGVAIFQRHAASGLLSFSGGVLDGVGGIDGLGFVSGLALSRDPARGEFLYASSFSDDAVSIFFRRFDGALIFEDFVRDGVGGVAGLDGANALVASPDDENLYAVATSGSSLVVFRRDISPPAPLALTSTTHTPGLPSNLATVALQWSGAADEGFGVGEYWLLLGTEAETVAPTGAPSLLVPHGSDPHAAELEAGEDGGNYHVHVTTCDLIGNCSPTHLGPLLIDTTPPSQPTGLVSTSHGSPNADPRIAMTWNAAEDPAAGSGYASGLAGYSWAFSTDDEATCDAAVEGGELTATSAILTAGTWYFHLCSVDVAGNLGPIQVSAPLTVEPDLVAPSVQQIDSVSRTDAGAIAPGQRLENAVTQFIVVFSESIGAGVDAASSYRLVEAGADGVPSLASCDGAPGDDVETVAAAVVYDDAAHTAYLDLPGDASLAAGSYRLLVCSSLADLQGNALDSGVDARLDFELVGNELANPNLDTGLAGWQPSNAAITHHLADDADSVPTSGSLEMLITEQAESVSQCVDLAEFPAFAEAELSSRVRITERSASAITARAHVRFFDQAACAGLLLATASDSGQRGSTGGVWIDSGLRTSVPVQAMSAEVVLEAAPDDIAGDGDVAFDRAALVPRLPLFADGFESGDLGLWSEVTSP